MQSRDILKMIRAYKLDTGGDGHSHVTKGFVSESLLTEVVSLRFMETPPHSFYDWHTAPVCQYVISLSGTLQFTTGLNEVFILKPGEILIAMDTTGFGHKWQLIDDEPWKRAYVVFKENTPINFTTAE